MRLTLNLLPPDKKRALRSGLLMAYAQTMVLLVFITAMFISSMLVSVRLMISSDYADLQKKSASASSGETTAVTNEIRLINTYLRQLEDRQESFTAWSGVIKSLADLVPDKTTLESLTIDAATDKITLSGEAETRDDALKLLDSLKNSPFLSDVSSPLSNLLQKKDVKFDLEMKYKRGEAE
jgi:Tfp pilus assembly protein PilN